MALEGGPETPPHAAHSYPRPPMRPGPWIANTDLDWFDFLRGKANGAGRLDEVNFWNPSGRKMRKLHAGEPVFFRLKSPRSAIAGYGFFAHFTTLRLDEAWDFFEFKNGADSLPEFTRLIFRNRHEAVPDLRTSMPSIGCTILRGVAFWEERRWIPWGKAEGWSRNVVTGRTEDDAKRASRLLGEIALDQLDFPEELSDSFVLLEEDERDTVLVPARQRVGQGTFRSRLLDAYGRRCAITGERTEPVLDAAHIQPYRGPGSNHVQNGVLLTKEFHKLFDLGYVTITPEHEVRVSPRLERDWHNGKRYYAYDGRPLSQVPASEMWRPSREALEWHASRLFLG